MSNMITHKQYYAYFAKLISDNTEIQYLKHNKSELNIHKMFQRIIMVLVCNVLRTTQITKNKLDHYLSNGYKLGRKI